MNRTRSSTIYSAIPSDWKIVPLSNLLRRVRKPVEVEADKLYREIGILSHGKGIFHKEERTGASLGNKSVFWVEPDCFIVNIVFAWEQAITKTTNAEKGMIASHRFPMYKPQAGTLDLDFLVSFFNTPQGKYLLGLASPGGAGRNKTLGQQAFLDLSIPLPSFPEQCKITDLLNTVDQAIALTERRIEAARQRRKGLMQRLLTGRVRFPEFVQAQEFHQSKLGQVPVDWRVVPIQNVARVNAETLGSNSNPARHYLYIELSAVDKGNIVMPAERQRFADLPSRARRVLRKGDVIMATVRPNLLGFAVCDFEPQDVLCSTGFALISPEELSDSQFIYQSLYSDTVLRQVHGLLTGSNYPAINASEVKKLRLFWPESKDERKRIATVLQACDREIELLTQKRDTLQRQKKGLMQRLLTGRVRVEV
jgi:type I restriction enzyme S subunit